MRSKDDATNEDRQGMLDYCRHNDASGDYPMTEDMKSIDTILCQAIIGGCKWQSCPDSDYIYVADTVTELEITSLQEHYNLIGIYAINNELRVVLRPNWKDMEEYCGDI